MVRYYLLVAGILILCVLIATGCGSSEGPTAGDRLENPPFEVEMGQDCLVQGGLPVYYDLHYVGCYVERVPE